MKRQPQGYAGVNHTTVGTDILAIQRVLTFPERTLGEELVTKLNGVQPDGWYPIDYLLQMMERIDTGVGRAGLVQLGRHLFRLSHEERVRRHATTAGDIIFGLDEMYRHANRGVQIGGWKVVQFEPGSATLHKTTPHHCAMEEGILMEALRLVDVPAVVTQSQCVRNDAPFCVYHLSSIVLDDQWMGRHAPIH